MQHPRFSLIPITPEPAGSLIRARQTTIGGYQVMKKWLSYRDFKVLGRDLTVAEARQVETMACRLTILKSLEAALNENYRACVEI